MATSNKLLDILKGNTGNQAQSSQAASTNIGRSIDSQQAAWSQALKEQPSTFKTWNPDTDETSTQKSNPLLSFTDEWKQKQEKKKQQAQSDTTEFQNRYARDAMSGKSYNDIVMESMENFKETPYTKWIRETYGEENGDYSYGGEQEKPKEEKKPEAPENPFYTDAMRAIDEAAQENSTPEEGYESPQFDFTNNRLANTVKGAAKQIGSAYTNALGTYFDFMGENGFASSLAEAQMRQNALAAPTLFSEDYLGMINDVRDSGDATVKQAAADVQKVADDLGGSAQADLAAAKDGLGKFGTAAVDIGTNVIQMGSDVLAGILTGGQSLVPMAIRVFGQSSQEARQEGASTNQQVGYGLTSAAIEVLTEKMADGLAGVYGKGGADEMVEETIRRLTKSDTGRAILRFMYGTASEGTEEVISDLLQPYAQMIYNDKSIAETFGEGYDQSELLYDYLIGAALGGLGGVANAANGNANAAMRETDAIQAALEQSGIDEGTAEQVAPILKKAEAGEELTKREKNILLEIRNREDVAAGSNEATNALTEALESDEQSATGEDIESTSVNTDPQEHTPQEQAIIDEYQGSTDDSLKSFVEKHIADEATEFARKEISRVSERQQADIENLLGGDYSGYTNNINSNAVKHILNRHGESGEADNSMADINDIARIGYVLDNYDTAELGKYSDDSLNLSGEFRDKDNNPAPVVKFTKKVNGTYYVVEAVPDSKWHKLWVVSAYMNKNGGITQAPGVQAPGITSETSPTSLPLGDSPDTSLGGEGRGESRIPNGASSEVSSDATLPQADQSVKSETDTAETPETIQSEIDGLNEQVSSYQEALDYLKDQIINAPEIDLSDAQENISQLQNGIAKFRQRIEQLAKRKRALEQERRAADAERRSLGRTEKGAKRTLNPTAETHIDNRTAESVGNRDVNAFQWDHPEIKPFFKRAAELLRRDLSFSQDSSLGRTTNRVTNKIIEKVLGRFGSIDEAIDACESIIFDKGRENFADPKRIELTLDEMLTDGYVPADKTLPVLNPDAEYSTLKGQLEGGTPYENNARARAIQRILESDFEGTMTEEEAAAEADRNFEREGYYDPYTKDGQVAEFSQDEEGRTTFEEMDEQDTAALEEKYGSQEQAEESVSEASESDLESQGESTPSETENQKQGQSEEFNSKSEAQAETDKAYNALVDEYGEIEQGENPARDVSVPKRTAPDNKVSESVRTVSEAEATPESRLPDVRSAVVSGITSYAPTTNDSIAEAARAKVKKNGWAKSVKDWTANVRSGKANADLVAEGAVLLNNAANNEECSGAEYVEIMLDYITLNHNLGRGLAAARILKTLSPEGKLYAFQKTVEKMNDAKAEKAAKKGKDAVDSLTEKYSIDPALIEEYREQTTDEGRDAVLEKMEQNIADQVPATLKDKFTALRYLNMLGNLKTQARNILGNTGNMLLYKAKNTVRSAMETVAQAVTDGKYEKQYSAFYGTEEKSAANQYYNTHKEVQEATMGERKYSNVGKQFEKGIEDKRTIFKSKILQKYSKITDTMMEAGDQIFCKATFTDALAGYMKAHNITAEEWTNLVNEADSGPASDAASKVDKAVNFAIKQAQESTFRDTNAVSKAFSTFDSNWSEFGKTLSQGIIPFRKTPANVLVRMEEFSPLGFINTTVKAVQSSKGVNNVTGQDVIDSLSKSLTGTALSTVGFILAAAGKARTKSDDDKQEAFDKLQGLQDYSITVGGRNYTIDWLTPEAASLFMGVELYNLAQDGTITAEDAIKIIGNLTSPMLEMSMLSGLNDALDNLSNFNDDTDALPQFLLNSAWGYISQGLTNTLIGQLEQMSEDYRQAYYTNPDNPFLTPAMQKMLAKAGNKTPGVDFQAADYIDAWGRKQANDENPFFRGFNALVNPAYVSDIDSKTTDIDDELQRLYEYGKDIDGFPNVYPQTVSRSTKINDTRLSPEEYDMYATTKGQKSLELVSDLINSSAYKRMSDDEKADAVSEMYSYAKYLASKEVAQSRKESYKASAKRYENMETAEKAGIEPTEFYEYYQKYKAIDNKSGSAQNHAEEFAVYVDKQKGLTQRQKDILKDSFKFSGGYTANTNTYDKWRAAGLSPDDARGFKDKIDSYGNSNGYISNAEIFAAIEDYAKDADMAEKLWQAAGSSTAKKKSYQQANPGTKFKGGKVSSGSTSGNPLLDILNGNSSSSSESSSGSDNKLLDILKAG